MEGHPGEGRGTVLFVDDDAQLCAALRRTLTTEGFTVETASSGTECLWRLDEIHPDVVVADLSMPGVDALAVVEAVKRADPEVEVIVATGRASAEAAIACMQRGAYGHLPKPFNMTELAMLLDRAIDRRRLQGTVALYEASRALLTTLGQDELVPRIVAQARRLVLNDGTLVALREGVHGPQAVHCAGDMPEELARAATELARTAQEAPGTLVLDVPGADGVSALVCPLEARTSQLGLAMLLRRARRGFSPLEQQRAATFAAQAALALDNARLYTAIEKLAVMDELTGVFTRRHLFQTLSSMILQLGRDGAGSLGCIMIDIDHFKRLNDTAGHRHGDRVLREVAERVRRSVRPYDVVGRYGGEEFVVVLPGARRDQSERVAERIRVSVARCESQPGLTISAGVAGLALDEPRWIDDAAARELAEKLIHKADMALYRAKTEGRDRVRLGDPVTGFFVPN